MTVVGDFALGALVGAGGMGAVYRATDLRSGDIVAVKVFGPEVIEAGALARFYQEARVHQGLTHPHIARFIAFTSTADHRPCLVMELIDGESLADIVATRGPFPVSTALRILAEVAAAVAHAHAHGIVHRDIKPGNVRLSPEGSAKLLDFGIAQPRGAAGITTPGHVVGTPRYLSPEQLLGEPATTASDVWALGILLYELTTGRVPFDDGTPADVWRSVSAGDYPAPSRCAALASGESTAAEWALVDALVARCLVCEPTHRTLTADAIARRAAGTSQPPIAPVQLARRAVVAGGLVGLALGVVLLWVIAGRQSGGTESIHHIDVSEGRATVVVNGRRVGRTPLTYRGTFGDVINVDLELPGYETLHEQIQIGVGGTSTFTLRPIQSGKDRR